MRILVVSQYFPPEGPAAFYASSVAQELAGRGHSVRVLTGYPNYPSGELFPGYTMKGRQRERSGDLEILRVPLYLDHSQSAVRRMANYLSFGASVSAARYWSRGADAIYVYATQMTPALGPWIWSMTGGSPYVLHVQDLWPDSITGSSMVDEGHSSRLTERVLTPWLSSVYRRSAGVIAIAPTMVDTLANRGVPRSKLHLVYNWTDESLVETGISIAGARDTTTILFAGNVGNMQDLDIAVRAAHNSRDAGIRLQIVGEGVALEGVRALAQSICATNVNFHGRVPRDEMAQFHADADYALVTLRDLPVFRGTIPSKLQSSLASGLPVISNVQGDVRAIIEGAGIGITAEGANVSSLERAFRKAAADSGEARRQMADRARATYAEQFSQSTAISMIEDVLFQAAQGQDGR